MAVEDIYNWDLMASLRTEVELHGYCVAFMEVLPQHYGLKELDNFGEQRQFVQSVIIRRDVCPSNAICDVMLIFVSDFLEHNFETD